MYQVQVAYEPVQFQSLSRDKRLSDTGTCPACGKEYRLFQSLSRDKRLSDLTRPLLIPHLREFQSLSRDKRLSDMPWEQAHLWLWGFNPSVGIKGFQTRAGWAKSAALWRFNPSVGIKGFQTALAAPSISPTAPPKTAIRQAICPTRNRKMLSQTIFSSHFFPRAAILRMPARLSGQKGRTSSISWSFRAFSAINAISGASFLRARTAIGPPLRLSHHQNA